MFYGPRLHRPSHGYYRSQTRSTSYRRGCQSGRGGEDQRGEAPHYRARTGVHATGGCRLRGTEGLLQTRGMRSVLHGRPDTVQGEP